MSVCVLASNGSIARVFIHHGSGSGSGCGSGSESEPESACGCGADIGGRALYFAAAAAAFFGVFVASAWVFSLHSA